MPNPTDGQPVPAVACEVAYNSMTTTAENICWVLVAEVALIYPFAGGDKGYAVVAIVHYSVLEQRVEASVYIDAICIPAHVRCIENHSRHSRADVAI